MFLLLLCFFYIFVFVVFCVTFVFVSLFVIFAFCWLLLCFCCRSQDKLLCIRVHFTFEADPRLQYPFLAPQESLNPSNFQRPIRGRHTVLDQTYFRQFCQGTHLALVDTGFERPLPCQIREYLRKYSFLVFCFFNQSKNIRNYKNVYLEV